jgi:hypothetical protein
VSIKPAATQLIGFTNNDGPRKSSAIDAVPIGYGKKNIGGRIEW